MNNTCTVLWIPDAFWVQTAAVAAVSYFPAIPGVVLWYLLENDADIPGQVESHNKQTLL